jgi:hypothetical protein
VHGSALRHGRCYVDSVKRELTVKPKSVEQCHTGDALIRVSVQRTTAPVQATKRDVIVEKQGLIISVRLSTELRERLAGLQDRRFTSKGHRLSFSDLAREALFLLLEREEGSQLTINHRTPNGLHDTVLAGVGSPAAGAAA